MAASCCAGNLSEWLRLADNHNDAACHCKHPTNSHHLGSISSISLLSGPTTTSLPLFLAIPAPIARSLQQVASPLHPHRHGASPASRLRTPRRQGREEKGGCARQSSSIPHNSVGETGSARAWVSDWVPSLAIHLQAREKSLETPSVASPTLPIESPPKGRRPDQKRDEAIESCMPGPLPQRQ